MLFPISPAGRCLVAAVLLAFVLTGCPRPSSLPTSGPAVVQQPLTLLVVDDPALGQAIAREWRSRTEEEITLRDVTPTEIVEAARLPGDVIIFPSGLLGEMVERNLIVPLDDTVLAQAEYDRRDIFDQVRLRELVWGNRTVAVPLGSPRLLLAYRSDVFERLGLQPPDTWPQYRQLVERLADREALDDLAPPEGEPWHAALEPLAGEWAAYTLLARAAAYAMHRDQVSALFDSNGLKPFVDRPPYVRALNDLVAAAQAGGFADRQLTPSEAWDELRMGHAAMALTWPPPAPPSLETTRPEPRVNDEQLGFALLPGAPTAYSFATKAWETRGAEDEPRVSLLATGGRMAAITATTADVRRAQGLLVWLAGREGSNIVGPQSTETTLFRTSQMSDAPRWTGLGPTAARRYAEALAETMALPRAHPGMRLPGGTEYLDALSNSVRSAIAGEQPSQQALTEAADKWRDITERIGLERQQRAHARSLGQESL